MGRYNQTAKEYTIAYKRANLKRVPFEITKSYYETMLKPAADAAGEAMNSYIRKAIEMRMKADGFIQESAPDTSEAPRS